MIVSLLSSLGTIQINLALMHVKPHERGTKYTLGARQHMRNEFFSQDAFVRGFYRSAAATAITKFLENPQSLARAVQTYKKGGGGENESERARESECAKEPERRGNKSFSKRIIQSKAAK